MTGEIDGKRQELCLGGQVSEDGDGSSLDWTE